MFDTFDTSSRSLQYIVQCHIEIASGLRISVSDREITPETPGAWGTGTFSRFFAGEGTVDILQCRVKWQDKVVQETNHGTGIRPSDSWYVITRYVDLKINMWTCSTKYF